MLNQTRGKFEHTQNLRQLVKLHVASMFKVFALKISFVGRDCLCSDISQIVLSPSGTEASLAFALIAVLVACSFALGRLRTPRGDLLRALPNSYNIPQRNSSFHHLKMP